MAARLAWRWFVRAVSRPRSSAPARPSPLRGRAARRVPGFWDPRRRPERPDLSRVNVIRFITEIDYPPFNYAGPDGNPAGFNVDLARTICEELKIACTVQMRRFDTLIDALTDNRGDAVIASIAVTPQSPQARRFQRPLLPHAGALRGAARRRDERRAARTARRQEGRGGRRHRARGFPQGAVHRGRAAAPIRTPSVRARRCATARSIFCSATASRWRSGSTAPTRRTAAPSAAGRSSRAASSAKASASRSNAATTRCGRRSTGRCSGCGRRAASPICGCAISRSARFDPIPNAIDAADCMPRPETMMSDIETAAASARARRAIERLAVRGGAQDRRAAEEEAEGRGDLRDRLRPVRPAAYRHVRRGGAHHHGAPRLPRAHRRQGQDAADRVLRRHGWPAQGAGQRAEQGDAGAASRQAADQVPDPFGTHPELRRSTTTRGCAPSSTRSASTTSSCRRPTATRRAASTRRCSRCWSASTR